MEDTNSIAQLAMAEEFKHQPGRAPIDPRREGSAMECAVMGRTPTDQPQPFFTPAGQLTSAGRDALAALGQAFRPIVLAARRAAAAMVPLTAATLEAQRGPTIGRKRRARRARGRAREQR